MLHAIKQFFEQNIVTDDDSDIEHRLKLATAALLIEMMQQDGNSHASEIDAVKVSLQGKFDLAADETDELFRLAREEAHEATDLHQFTSLIHRHFSMQQKVRVIEHLWAVAFADNHLDAYEEQLLRRIADLLYVPHKYFIQAKHKVLAAREAGNG
jgi:uncharacterized tellurite resistance protein B-like protein